MRRAELVRYLESVRGLYPFGIPRSPPVVARRAEIPKVVWIRRAGSAPARELLQGVVTKGLMLPMAEVVDCEISEETQLPLADAVRAAAKRAPRVIVVLAEQEEIERELAPLARGHAITIDGVLVAASHALEAVLNAPEKKRELWRDLQTLLPLLKTLLIALVVAFGCVLSQIRSAVAQDFISSVPGTPTVVATGPARNGAVPAGSVQSPVAREKFVALIDMEMMILPGTSGFLRESIEQASREGAALLVVRLNTPGGVLQTTQEMIEEIFSSPIPVVVYVGPTGGSATSAGVFITLAAHVAVMAPGTSIGAAHPVAGDGKDIEGDMRTKAENMTIAMIKSISEQRGRNVSWAEKAVKESNSITEREALSSGVIDFVATDIRDLLTKIQGKEVRVQQEVIKLGDYSGLSVRPLAISTKHQLVNVLANPNVAALLWLAATTGISIELYNPGAVLPGVVGIIALVLALSVSQVIPISQAGIALLVVGGVLLVGELYVTTGGILGVGGVVALILGAFYLFDQSLAPGVVFHEGPFILLAALVGVGMLFLAFKIAQSQRRPPLTGSSAMLGLRGVALENIAVTGRVIVQGEIWKAVCNGPLIEKGAPIEVINMREGLLLEVVRADGEK